VKLNFNFAAVVISFVVPLALSGTTLAQAADSMSQKYPDVMNVMVQARDQNRFDFDVTISSP
jgi:hypothetical protein